MSMDTVGRLAALDRAAEGIMDVMAAAGVPRERMHLVRAEMQGVASVGASVWLDLPDGSWAGRVHVTDWSGPPEAAARGERLGEHRVGMIEGGHGTFGSLRMDGSRAPAATTGRSHQDHCYPDAASLARGVAADWRAAAGAA